MSQLNRRRFLQTSSTLAAATSLGAFTGTPPVRADAWTSAPFHVRLPPQTFQSPTAGRMACAARSFVASRPGTFRNVNRESRCFPRWAVGGMALHRRHQSFHRTLQASADDAQAVSADLTGRVAVPGGERLAEQFENSSRETHGTTHRRF